jgi:tetratricopeptide (TPR) repeat protein
LWDLGSTNEAASEYEKILQYSPNDPTSLNNLAIIYGQQGRYLDAIPLLRRLLNLSQEKTAAINLANCYFFLGRFDEAIATYNLVLELDPDSATASHGLADAYEKIGKPIQSRLFLEKAVAGYDDVLAITGPHAFYLSNRAVCAAKLGSYTEAIDNVHEAERLAPQSSAVHFKASEVYALAGNWQSSYDYMERSIQNGYSRQEFENSPVFASHLDDPEFRRILESGID